MKKCILLANGKAPKKSVFPFLYKNGYTTILCADGGANTARKLDIIPDYIIGDLDSISKENYKFFADKTKVIKLKRQNDTDVEKCLKFAIKKGVTDCILLGVIGDRLDHSFCNLGIVIKFSELINIRILDEKSLLSIHSGEVHLKTIPSEIISLYAFNNDTKITSAGLKYKLDETALTFGVRDGTSNRAVGHNVKLNIQGGKIFIIRDFNTVKSNGLF